MTEPASSPPSDLTDLEKSAVVMRLIGQETAAEVVKFLSQPEINRLSVAMTRISTVSRNAAASVLREFADLMRQDGSLDANGGEEYLRGVLEKALGAEKADHLLGRLRQGGYGAGIDAVKWQDPRDLADMVKTEHPQIIARIRERGETDFEFIEEQRALPVSPDGRFHDSLAALILGHAILREHDTALVQITDFLRPCWAQARRRAVWCVRAK